MAAIYVTKINEGFKIPVRKIGVTRNDDISIRIRKMNTDVPQNYVPYASVHIKSNLDPFAFEESLHESCKDYLAKTDSATELYVDALTDSKVDALLESIAKSNRTKVIHY